jgi:hypothetical protein
MYVLILNLITLASGVKRRHFDMVSACNIAKKAKWSETYLLYCDLIGLRLQYVPYPTYLLEIFFASHTSIIFG